MDAVGLVDSNRRLIGHADTVVANGQVTATTCGRDNPHPDAAVAKGAPDGDRDTGFVSLRCLR